LFKNREDVLRLLIGNYVNEEDLGKRPLAKLIKDISDALGLI
jgi:ribosomal protein S6